MNKKYLGLKQQIIIAAGEISKWNCENKFTQEELLVKTWENNKETWGIRGFEGKYPDLNKIQREIDSRGGDQKGLVDLGLLNRVEQRVYVITPKGLTQAGQIKPKDKIIKEKIYRTLESEIRRIIEHPVLRKWLLDSNKPKVFREAGNFWGIAPGTPPKTVRDRIYFIDHTLNAAIMFMDDKNINAVSETHGKILFERNDIDRAMDFQLAMKERFSKELKLLDPNIKL